MPPSLRATNLRVVRGERCLFTDLNFVLEPGQLLILEGPNGSGKTSLLKAIAGLIELDAGEIHWGEAPVETVRQEFFASLVWFAHRVGLKADLTLVENLRFEAALRPTRGTDFDSVLETLHLDRLQRLPLRSLSAGQQRRVAFARLLLAKAPLWLLDEPFTNLDREGRELVLRFVAEHVAKGGLCVMAAHQDVELDVPTKRVLLQ